MTALELFQHLQEQQVILLPSPDGTIRCRAPAGVLTPALVEAMRQHKTALHALLEEWHERAAIAEYCGRLPRIEAEQVAWQWCRETLMDAEVATPESAPTCAL